MSIDARVLAVVGSLRLLLALVLARCLVGVRSSGFMKRCLANYQYVLKCTSIRRAAHVVESLRGRGRVHLLDGRLRRHFALFTKSGAFRDVLVSRVRLLVVR